MQDSIWIQSTEGNPHKTDRGDWLHLLDVNREINKLIGLSFWKVQLYYTFLVLRWNLARNFARLILQHFSYRFSQNQSCKKPRKIDSSAFFTEHSLKHLARNLARFFSLFTEAFSNNFRTLPIFFTHMNLLAVAWPVGQDLALIFYTIYI